MTCRHLTIYGVAKAWGPGARVYLHHSAKDSVDATVRLGGSTYQFSGHETGQDALRAALAALPWNHSRD